MTMGVHKLSVELSDRELDILQMLADRDGITATEALKRAIIQAGYLRKQEDEGRALYVGNIDRGRVNVGKVKWE